MNANDPKLPKDPNQAREPKTNLPEPPPLSSPAKTSSAEPSKIYTAEPHDTSRISDTESKTYEKTQKESVEGEEREDLYNKRYSKKLDEMYDYAKYNKEQTVAYILLIIGILLIFFSPILGELLIGLVGGFYFSKEIISYIRNLGQIAGGPDHTRYVILTAILLGILIVAPGFFIGAVIAAAFRKLFFEPDSDKPIK